MTPEQNTTTPDYGDFVEQPAPKNEALAAIQALVDQARILDAQAAIQAQTLATTQEKLRDILTRQLPTLMEDNGMTEFSNAAGLKVEVKEEVHAGISEANRPAAFLWLEDNGHGTLIKREISVAFNREQQEQAKQLLADLQGKFAGVCEERKVHPSTLKAWAKEMLEKGADLPVETFGIFRQKIAKIGAAKKAKRA